MANGLGRTLSDLTSVPADIASRQRVSTIWVGCSRQPVELHPFGDFDMPWCRNSKPHPFACLGKTPTKLNQAIRTAQYRIQLLRADRTGKQKPLSAVTPGLAQYFELLIGFDALGNDF